MHHVEQAIFTSAETDRSAGYQLVAASPGVTSADARELAAWGPSHDSLLTAAPGGSSVNFHLLPSGAFSVSRTTAAGSEYSGRRGPRVFTQCLVVAPEALARFANNPFAVVRAARAAGTLRLHEDVPRHLDPLKLAGRASAVDASLLTRLRSNPGAEWMATLVQAVLSSKSVALVGGPPAEQVIAGLVNCFPIPFRPELSFSTGLKFSPRRPFRLVALADDAEERRRVRRLYDLAVLDLDGDPPAEFSPDDAWPHLIRRVLRTGRTSLLSHHLADPQPDFSVEDLPALGLQLLEELDATSLGGPRSDPPRAGTIPRHKNACRAVSPADESPMPTIAPDGPASPAPTRAHEAHHRFSGQSAAAGEAATRIPGPSKTLPADDPQILSRLQRLDDLVYEAVQGNTASIDQLKTLWPRLRRELGDNLLAESREQYLHYALSLWHSAPAGVSPRDPAPSAEALDVLCLLFEAV